MNTTLNQDVLFDEIEGRDGILGLITLNRPAVLNALNHGMFLALDRQLREWEEADHIKAVMIQGEGRAFCAGGDIRSAYERNLARDASLPLFFSNEYSLNQRIYHYNKPYIALLNGITMGGGAGISIHGSHRIATERFVFAMPETTIGFYPDVGATYFLPRLVGKMGYYLGLTGARIDYQDAFALGLVNYIVSPNIFPELIAALTDTSLAHHADAVVSDIINHFAQPAGESNLMSHQVEIDACFGKSSVEDIILALEHYPSEWCQEIAALLKTKSPTSLKVTMQQLKEGAKLGFDQCIELEYRLTNHFLQGHDFMEGVRALIIDKDQAPQWQPARLEEVSEKAVMKYFEK